MAAAFTKHHVRIILHPGGWCMITKHDEHLMVIKKGVASARGSCGMLLPKALKEIKE
jgi:hypothetical protein